jgi:predicted RecB family nuclease
MQLSGSDFYRAYRPSECDMRIYLHHKGIQAAEPGPYEEVIRRLGDRHEKAYLATFPDVLDLTQGTREERQTATREAIRAGAAVIYQPLFAETIELAGRACEVVGIPDFLMREGDGYVIRDAKITRRIADHPEILWQLRLYGWLFERAIGRPPLRLEVFNGKSELIPIEAEPAEEQLTRLAALVADANAPFEPVGWSRCGGCGYNDRCWSEAKARNDVAMVLKVDKGLARALRSINVVSYDDLLAQFDEARLSAFEKPWGKKTQKVGKAATDILLSARALQTGLPIRLGPVVLPEKPNFVMFDLEGLPPHLDDLEKIYLWGMQVYGDKPSEFMAATAGFGVNGDKEGWDNFLACAEKVMAEYGAIPFVHWSHYEKTKINLYIKRHGDPNGIAAAVINNLLDLLPVTQDAVMLPLPSYSLKVVEEYVGFKRTQDEYGGAWSMAQYIEATETEDQDARQKVMDTILKYNEEDLGATWAVLCWLKSFGEGLPATA